MVYIILVDKCIIECKHQNVLIHTKQEGICFPTNNEFESLDSMGN